MDKYIKRSLLIVRGDLDTDENSFNHAVKELNERVDKMQNVFNEVRSKGLLMKDIDPELDEEMTEILLTLTLYETRFNN